ncbi:hypothetical protein [Streptomyces galbus]|uniref:Transposase n=1 Tax=Streptomyces galbus TaxID=33898 RepID=A0ABX1IR67_STRGB|nr:hypothetical protein [Streptomyces galbus]NKQ26687.1 hypothetical protein [Streptomyces galbus]
MDLDAVADELYGLSPGDFTSAREVRAKSARSAGDLELADRIHRLRRPTLSAWASNLLVRDQPEETRRLLQLGQALRQATEDLDGDQLRELSAQQRKVTSALARQAADLARQAGQPISEDAQREVQETLQAVLADPDAGHEWAEGRLARPLSAPVGFPALSSRVSSIARPASRRKEPAAPPGARSATKSSARTADLEAARARRRAQQERLEQARQQAADAERELTEREERLTAVQDEQRQAEERARDAEERIAELTCALGEAEGERNRARDAARNARDQAREAEHAVKEARRSARQATAQARRLAEQPRRKGS